VGGIGEWEIDGRSREIISRNEVEFVTTNGGLAIDMRSPTAFNAGHIEGAWNHSAAALIADPAGILSGVSFDTAIVIYGSGGPVAEEYEAANAMAAAGFTSVLYYSPGWLGWE
jgi:rhodanese-related sulfurtransferase